MGNILATGVRRPDTNAFDAAIQERFDLLETDALLVYLVDLVAADALPYLAEQFNVDGIKGYAFATTDEDKRTLLSRAIELNKLKGTAFSVVQAIVSIGYSGASVRDRSALTYNGSWVYDGVNDHGTTNWANAVINIRPATPTTEITAEQLAVIQAVVSEYKNVRVYITKYGFQPYNNANLEPVEGWTAFQHGSQWYLWPMVTTPSSLAGITTFRVNNQVVPSSNFTIIQNI